MRNKTELIGNTLVFGKVTIPIVDGLVGTRTRNKDFLPDSYLKIVQSL